ncbi:MAG: TIGR00282 family metallophosphoesterase [Candidatus Poribacteria bacterium]|nr:TIGR00282 family metallophosphoesterase [Candidatus Poribacteria bacterium]
MKFLFIGDIVGRPGREAALALMPILTQKHGPFDAVIANAENAAGGKGVTRAIVDELFEWGVDVITTGNHVWAQREVFEFIDTVPNLIRPANFPKNTPGRGSIVATTNAGVEIGVINIAGQVYMENYENPFHTLDFILPQIRAQTKLVIVDFHAEATSEKIAMGWYADGKVSAIIGTHTHVQTADERVLPQGTAYITDVGMTGPHDSVIGMKKDIVLRRFLTMLPVRHKVADDDVMLSAVVLELDEKTGKAISIQRIRHPFNKNA